MSDDQPTWRPPDERPRRPTDQPGWHAPDQPSSHASEQPPLPGSAPPRPEQPASPPIAPGHQDLPQTGPGWAPPPGSQHGEPGYPYWPAQPSAPPRSGNRTLFIVIGLVVALLVGLLVVAFLIGSSLGNLAELGTRTPLDEVAIGECFDGIGSGDSQGDNEVSVGLLFGVEVIDCAEEHEAELIGRTAWPLGTSDEYPGDEEVETFAFNECLEIFDTYVGRSYFDSTLEMTYTFPRRASWMQGSRGVECIAHPPAGIDTHSGSVRGVNR